METGTLYIVATPIGNLGDITFRAIKILSEAVDVVFCEDTRQTKKLLNSYRISIPTQSLHTHSPDQKIDRVIDLLAAGKSVAYVTDSGTPGLSDPGAKLVSRARAAGFTVSPVPGPSALTSLISVSGYQGKNIMFAGFLSKKPNKLKNELKRLKKFEGLIIVYESPYRIKKLIAALYEIFPLSKILIGRELTKIYEEISLKSSEEFLHNMDGIIAKGEFVISIFNEKDDSE
jgi:16S rRNA (cytidine1402-2'-O)-methyltransferase